MTIQANAVTVLFTVQHGSPFCVWVLKSSNMAILTLKSAEHHEDFFYVLLSCNGRWPYFFFFFADLRMIKQIFYTKIYILLMPYKWDQFISMMCMIYISVLSNYLRGSGWQNVIENYKRIVQFTWNILLK